MIALLAARETLTSPDQAHRYMVELASNELDFEGVPVEYKTVDVVVVEPSDDAITTLLVAAGYLEGYQIVSHWIPSDCDYF